jgi:hypothetical protein
MAFKRHHFQPDTPTNNFATWNPLVGRYKNSGSPFIQPTFSEGNTKVTGDSSDVSHAISSLASSGKHYAEFSISGGTNSITGVGVSPAHWGNINLPSYVENYGGSLYRSEGVIAHPVSNLSAIVISDEDTRIGIEVDFSNNIASYYTVVADGTKTHHGDTPAGMEFNNLGCFSCSLHNSSFSVQAHFDEGEWWGTPNSGYLALCTENLPVTPITAHLGEEPGDYFKAYAYSGLQGVEREHNVGFEPDLIWVKNRTSAQEHNIIDSVRGITSGPLFSNDSGTGDSSVRIRTHSKGITTFGNFDYTNTDNADYIAWCWKAGGSAGKYNVDGKAYASAAEAGLNAGNISITGASINTKSGFSIVKWSGNDTAGATYPHGFSQAPELIITKCTNASVQWIVYSSTVNSTGYLSLADSFDASRNSWFINNTPPSSSVITSGYSSGTHNDSSHDYITYCWHSVPGYSKFGSYTGNGSADGPYVHCGFRPAWVMVKPVSGNHWSILDSARDEYNPARLRLLPANSNSESGVGPKDTFDFLSNGFKLRTTDPLENNSGEVIFMAFAEQPQTPASRVTIPKPDLKVNDMRSMYFDKTGASSSDSNVLYTTLGTATNDKVFTYSLWVKPLNGGHHGGDGLLLCMKNKTGNGGTGKGFPFRGGDTTLNFWLGSSKVFKGEIKTGDENKWYHLVLQCHNNDGQRGNVYIDGQLDPSLTEIDLNEFNLASGEYITIGGYDAGIHGFHGYMANVHLIDGQALEPLAFAESVDDVWIPKQYEGAYGNIGFHLDFAPENMVYSGDTITRVLDESPNSNHWDAK